MSLVKYVGVDDPDLDLFESQYELPEGMCYNSYIIEDEDITIVDSVDPRKTDAWLGKVAKELNGRQPKYLIVQHIEPDHSGSVAAAVNAYPNIILVGSAKAFQFLDQFNPGLKYQSKVVGEGETLCIGKSILRFFTAPMVHWPEVIVTYLEAEKTLFSADAFGKFGVYDADPEDWACEARRYYFNICGKYGAQVVALLKKASTLAIDKICPLHGPVLEGERMANALRLYNIWSKYDVETPGVLVAYASIHGNTKKVAEKVAEMLEKGGAPKVAITDLCRDDIEEAIEDSFRMDTLVLAASTYDGSVFPPMFLFLHKLALKGYRNRRVALIENGTWTPMAAKVMKEQISTMRNVTVLEPTVTIKSAMTENDMPQIQQLVNAVLQEYQK